MTKHESIAEILRALKYANEHPEEGPFYVHETIGNEALLIEFIELYLPMAAGEAAMQVKANT